MKITVKETIPEVPDFRRVDAGEWEAEPATIQLPGRQRRECQGFDLRRRLPGYGWVSAALSREAWDREISTGNIVIHQEGDTMSANLPAVKMESAVLTVSPQEQINQASDMARLLKEVVSKAGLARKLGGRKEHLEYEAWATIARWFHCTPSTEWTRPIKQDDKIIGWEARVNILDETGRVIGSSEGMCMSDEANWRNKPTYALRSMAQTRTAGKALRSLFAHIAVLAGYSPTPAEEMDGVLTQDDGLRHAEPQAPPKQSNGDEASKEDKKGLLAIAREKFKTDEKAMEFIKWCQGKEPYWTDKMVKELSVRKNFDEQAALFADAQRSA